MLDRFECNASDVVKSEVFDENQFGFLAVEEKAGDVGRLFDDSLE